MLQIKSLTNRQRFLLLWITGITLGWTLIIYPGLIYRDRALSSWAMLLPIALNLLVFSFLLGAIIGLMQYVFCRFDIAISWKWILISAFSYGIGTSIAFLFSSTLIGITTPAPLSSGGSSSMSMPLDFTMLFGGGLTALIQALAIRNIFSGNTKEMLLWVLATALSWEAGFFISAYALGANLPLFLQSGLAGLAIGLASALLLNIEIKNMQNQITNTATKNN